MQLTAKKTDSFSAHGKLGAKNQRSPRTLQLAVDQQTPWRSEASQRTFFPTQPALCSIVCFRCLWWFWIPKCSISTKTCFDSPIFVADWSMFQVKPPWLSIRNCLAKGCCSQVYTAPNCLWPVFTNHVRQRGLQQVISKGAKPEISGVSCNVVGRGFSILLVIVRTCPVLGPIQQHNIEKFGDQQSYKWPAASCFRQQWIQKSNVAGRILEWSCHMVDGLQTRTTTTPCNPLSSPSCLSSVVFHMRPTWKDPRTSYIQKKCETFQHLLNPTKYVLCESKSQKNFKDVCKTQEETFMYALWNVSILARYWHTCFWRMAKNIRCNRAFRLATPPIGFCKMILGFPALIRDGLQPPMSFH